VEIALSAAELQMQNEEDTAKTAVNVLTALLAETHHNLGCIGSESNQPSCIAVVSMNSSSLKSTKKSRRPTTA
jgi:hypothetical protein